eukprot:1733686-Rhodomonas_salina.4
MNFVYPRKSLHGDVRLGSESTSQRVTFQSVPYDRCTPTVVPTNMQKGVVCEILVDLCRCHPKHKQRVLRLLEHPPQRNPGYYDAQTDHSVHGTVLSRHCTDTRSLFGGTSLVTREASTSRKFDGANGS